MLDRELTKLNGRLRGWPRQLATYKLWKENKEWPTTWEEENGKMEINLDFGFESSKICTELGFIVEIVLENISIFFTIRTGIKLGITSNSIPFPARMRLPNRPKMSWISLPFALGAYQNGGWGRTPTKLFFAKSQLKIACSTDSGSLWHRGHVTGTVAMLSLLRLFLSLVTHFLHISKQIVSVLELIPFLPWAPSRMPCQMRYQNHFISPLLH